MTFMYIYYKQPSPNHYKTNSKNYTKKNNTKNVKTKRKRGAQAFFLLGSEGGNLIKVF